MIRLALSIVILAAAVAGHAAPIIPAAPQLAARAYLLMDAHTGEVLVEHEADLPLPPASLTKLMTSYVLAAELAAGRVSNTDMVAVSTNAWSQNPLFAGSSLMWIEPGKDVSIEDLHRGIVVSSGNDATVAVAEHLGGNEAAFADMMNGHAEALGMRDTWYVNSHGLPHPEHLTTARDLATLARALIRDYPEAYKLYEEREFTYNNIRQFNRNTLLGEDPTVDGVKTGHTEEAGYCLVASAERRGMRLVSVVMGASSLTARKNETRSLLNYGFRFFESVDVYEPGEELATPKVWKGAQNQLSLGLAEGVALTIPRGQRKKLDSVLEVDPEIMAPVSVGQQLGVLKLMLDGEVLKEVPLVALEAVEPGGIFKRLWHWLLLLVISLFQAS
jgi:D-alanyl-D-alanine carboxypeptidase (penicillin-binding protein 5/6)